MRPQQPLPPLAANIANARFLVFGFLEHPYGLRARGYGINGLKDAKTNVYYEVDSILLGFRTLSADVSPQFGDRTFEVTSADRRSRQLIMRSDEFDLPPGATRPDGSDLPPDVEVVDDTGHPYLRYETLAEAQAKNVPTAPCLIARFPIGDITLSARIDCLSRRDKEWSFMFGNADGVSLSGKAKGWKWHEFFSLLTKLAPIQDHPDVIARYQQEVESGRSL
ncbi:MAG TPA: hypothetical protein VKQ36_17510 [Ktedonobacterales bacterium]|nr:hypothetical protein [Ktedonobacterales bacterium]